MDVLLTPAEVAERLKVEIKTVRRLIRDGVIPSHALGERIIRVSPSDLDEYLKRTRTKL